MTEIISPKLRKLLSQEQLKALEPAIEVYRREKRNFSDLSASGQDTRRQGKLAWTDDSRLTTNAAIIDQKLKEVAAEYETKQQALAALTTCSNDGDIKSGDYRAEVINLETEIGDLLTTKVILQSKRNELAGALTDMEKFSVQTLSDEGSYMELLMARHREPSGATTTVNIQRHEAQQRQWRNALLKAYDAISSSGKLAWCPISGRWHPAECVTACHIVRHNVGEWCARHLFGNDVPQEGHLWNLTNGIPLMSVYEKLLDYAKIAIIPTPDGQDLMVTVLDESLMRSYPELEECLDPLGPKLDGLVLKFRNARRPGRRYLYFCFAMNILRRQRYAVPGWWQDRIKDVDTTFFASAGKWVRRTTLRKLARSTGHLTEDDAEDFLGIVAGGSTTVGQMVGCRGNDDDGEAFDGDDEDGENEDADERQPQASRQLTIQGCGNAAIDWYET